jgi:hypothetical protein
MRKRLPQENAYVQLVDGDRLIERDLRAEAEAATYGQVLEASYLEHRGILARALGFLLGDARSAALTLAPPFDAEGRDLHGLFDAAAEVPALEPRGAAIHQVRRARGRIVALDPEPPADGVVLRSFWLRDAPALHACQAFDFAILPDAGPPLVLSLGMAPLVVAPPVLLRMDAFLARVDARTRRLLDIVHVKRPPDEEGALVELAQGHVVEVLCVVREAIDDARSFLLGGALRALPIDLSGGDGGPYRASTDAHAILAGDAPGMRAVLRRIA